MNKFKLNVTLPLIAGILILVNLISYQLFVRLDLTEDSRYTMGKATANLLKNLDAVVSIKVYFSQEVPPELVKLRRDVQELLLEYENRSGGNVVYEFINPNETEESEAEVQKKGISPIIVNMRERDQTKQLRVYMGAILSYEDRQENIPFIRPNDSYEYIFTSAIKKVSVRNKPKVAILQGKGLPPINELFQLSEKLSVLYDVEPYTISDNTPISSEYKVAALINPKDTLPANYFEVMDDFLSSGRGIFIGYNNLEGDLSGGGSLLQADDIGVTSWLSEKDIEIDGRFLIDEQCGQVSISQQQSFFTFQTAIDFPYFPTITEFSEHPISKGLEILNLTFTSSVQLPSQKDSLKKIVPLAYSSKNSGYISPPAYIDINKEWTKNDYPEESQPIAIAAEGALTSSNTPTKMVFVGNGDFIVNEGGPQGGRYLPEDNINFAVNAIDWIADDTGLIDLRTKTITSRPLDDIEPATKDLLSYLNILLPICIALIYAFFRQQRNLTIKQKRIMGQI